METDFFPDPEAFARANACARDAHLRALTLESAAEEMEALFAIEEELAAAREALGLAPLPLPPLPTANLTLLLSVSERDSDSSSDDGDLP